DCQSRWQQQGQSQQLRDLWLVLLRPRKSPRLLVSYPSELSRTSQSLTELRSAFHPRRRFLSPSSRFAARLLALLSFYTFAFDSPSYFLEVSCCPLQSIKC